MIAFFKFILYVLISLCLFHLGRPRLHIPSGDVESIREILSQYCYPFENVHNCLLRYPELEPPDQYHEFLPDTNPEVIHKSIHNTEKKNNDVSGYKIYVAAVLNG